MKRISLYKEFGSNMLTRNSLADFFRRIIDTLEDTDIIIDFENIKFISRSCVAEYLKLRERTDKNLAEKNMSKEVMSMFNVVLNQLKNTNFIFRKIPSIGKLNKAEIN